MCGIAGFVGLPGEPPDFLLRRLTDALTHRGPDDEFNGEVYNFQELRSTLAGSGHAFRGTSDTEVMLSAFEQWGVHEAVLRFNGMFALAVWDGLERRLHLIRDRLGVKPLYYQWWGGTLYFSSEMSRPSRSLTTRCISPRSLALYFHHNWIPTPYTIFEGVYKLPPGEIATVSVTTARGGQFESQQKFWNTRDAFLAYKLWAICMFESWLDVR